MLISDLEQQESHIIYFQGDFDAASAQTVRNYFEVLVQQIQKIVILNLKHVEFIDSSGIGAIVFLYKRLRCQNLELQLQALQAQPLEIIQLLRIDKIIKILP